MSSSSLQAVARLDRRALFRWKRFAWPIFKHHLLEFAFLLLLLMLNVGTPPYSAEVEQQLGRWKAFDFTTPTGHPTLSTFFRVLIEIPFFYQAGVKFLDEFDELREAGESRAGCNRQCGGAPRIVRVLSTQTVGDRLPSRDAANAVVGVAQVLRLVHLSTHRLLRVPRRVLLPLGAIRSLLPREFLRLHLVLRRAGHTRHPVRPALACDSSPVHLCVSARRRTLALLPLHSGIAGLPTATERVESPPAHTPQTLVAATNFPAGW